MTDTIQNLLIVGVIITQTFQIRREAKMWDHIKDLWGKA